MNPINKLLGSKKEADQSKIHKYLQQLHALFIENKAPLKDSSRSSKH